MAAGYVWSVKFFRKKWGKNFANSFSKRKVWWFVDENKNNSRKREQERER